MKRNNPIRDSIDESLSGVRFNAHDERAVLRAIRSREEERPAAPQRRRRFRPDFAFALLLLAIVAVPLSLSLMGQSGTRITTAAHGHTTDTPGVLLATPKPQLDPVVEVTAESAVIAAARACFEAQCDTSVFSFEEYAVSVSSEPSADGGALYTVTMESVYDNGCAFTAIVAYPSCEVVQHSTPELATTPMHFDGTSDEVKSWYERYGAYPFTWDLAAQAEFSRRYKGASLRENREGELTPDDAAAAASKHVLANGTLGSGEISAYPVLYSERASDDGAARYVVYCFAQPVADTLAGPCVAVTLLADSAAVESVEVLSAQELEQQL